MLFYILDERFWELRDGPEFPESSCSWSGGEAPLEVEGKIGVPPRQSDELLRPLLGLQGMSERGVEAV